MVTVLITLGIHKIYDPSQDIRRHMKQIPGGFGGRTIDTQFISPTLGQFGYPFCKESGWLSRSLEQPHPYDENFPGNIKRGKKTFLNLVRIIEKEPEYAEDIIMTILGYLNDIKKKNTVTLVPLTNPDTLSSSILFRRLKKLINKKYKGTGGAKLPVLIIYSCMKLFCNEVERYKSCEVKSLGSHLSPDSRSKSSGDIEIFKDGILFESYEVKLKRKITYHLVNNVIKEKIYRHNPKRYFVLSSQISAEDKKSINNSIKKIKKEHGCEIIIDDPMKLIKRYINLLEDLEQFLNYLSKIILSDIELKIEHKEEWKKLYENLAT